MARSMQLRGVAALWLFFCSLPQLLKAQEADDLQKSRQAAAFQVEIEELRQAKSKAEKLLSAEMEKVKALTAENEQLKESASKFSKTGEEVPYLNLDSLSGLAGEIQSLASTMGGSKATEVLASVPLPANMQKHWSTLTDQALSAYGAMKEKAETYSAQAAEAAQGYAKKASSAALDLHKTLEPHIGEHIKQGTEAYYEDLHPHVEVAKEMASVKLQEAQDLLKKGLNASFEGGWSAIESLSDHAEVLRTHSNIFLDTYHGLAGERLEYLTAPLSYKFGGKTFKFAKGMLDVAAAGIQALVLAYILYIIIWRVALRTLLWKLGVKLLGRTTVTFIWRLFRFCISVVLFGLRFVWSMAMSVLGLMQSVTALSFTTLIFFGAVYGVEVSLLLGLGMGQGLKLRYRLALSTGLGFLAYLALRIRRKPKASATEGKKEKKNGKDTSNGNAKDATKGEDKAKPKATAKADGGKAKKQGK